jgi:hypothetical protein
MTQWKHYQQRFMVFLDLPRTTWRTDGKVVEFCNSNVRIWFRCGPACAIQRPEQLLTPDFVEVEYTT